MTTQTTDAVRELWVALKKEFGMTRPRLAEIVTLALASEYERGTSATHGLVAALQRLDEFAQHRGGCAFIDGGAGSSCDCGLDDAQEQARTALKKAGAL